MAEDRLTERVGTGVPPPDALEHPIEPALRRRVRESSSAFLRSRGSGNGHPGTLRGLGPDPSH